MPDARVEPVEIDVWGARAFMERARELLADGARSENTPASRMILLHSAAMAACDAILSINGKRIVGSDGSHRLRLEQAETLLRGDNRRLFATLEDSRASRNLASYAAGFVPADDIEASCAAVDELVAIAAVHVDAQSPGWALDD